MCGKATKSTPDYDPMLAKLIVWAPSRVEALEKMRRALDEFIVLGTTTNIEFLRDLCDAQPVVNGTTTTTTIDDVWPNGWNPPSSPVLEDAALLAAAGAEHWACIARKRERRPFHLKTVRRARSTRSKEVPLMQHTLHRTTVLLR